VDLEQELPDIRGMRERLAAVYDPDSYHASQALGARLRAENAWGVVYDSVRHAGGECAAVFRTPALANCRQSLHLCYVWDGERISQVYRKSFLKGR
jgi:hypothetical protein